MLQDWQTLACEAWQSTKNVDSETGAPTREVSSSESGERTSPGGKTQLLESIHRAYLDFQKVSEEPINLDGLTIEETAYAEAAVIDYLVGIFGEQDDALGNWPTDWHECPEAFDLYKAKIRELRAAQAKVSLDEVKRIAETQPEHSAMPIKEPPVLAEEPPKPAETDTKDEPRDPLSWIHEMYDSSVWKEFAGSGEQWIGPFDPNLRFHEDSESLADILTVKDCIAHLKKILPYWIEYQFVSPKSDILADMTHTIRCWLTKVRHDSNQRLPPIPSDLIGMADWIPDVEKVLAGGTTRKETDYTAQEPSAKLIKKPTETEQKNTLWRDIEPDMKRAIQDFWKDSQAKKSEGKRLLIKKFCRKRGLNESTFRSEKDRVETRRKRLRKAD